MKTKGHIQLRLEVSEEVHRYLKAIQEQLQLEEHQKKSLATIAEIELGKAARKEYNHADHREAQRTGDPLT